MTADSADESTYSIGAVARLTGIPVDTVRMWERRYAVVQPRRNVGNKRRYGSEDVARLTLIKRLVDRGNPISTVAALTEQQLRERLQQHEHADDRAKPLSQSLRALIYGETLPFLVDAQLDELQVLQIEGTFTNYGDFERQAQESRSDVLVFEYPALNAEDVSAILELSRRVGNRLTIVVYGFAPSSALARLKQRRNLQLLRSPTTLSYIESVCSGHTAAALTQGSNGLLSDNLDESIGKQAPRRFDDASLARITQISTSVKCECPRHLADLLYRLCAFEAYSLDCESRNEKDQAIHAYLYHATAHSRTVIEKALAHLIELEGLDVDAPVETETFDVD